MHTNIKNIIAARIMQSFLLPQTAKEQLLEKVPTWTSQQCECVEVALRSEDALLREIVEHCIEQANREGNIELLRSLGKKIWNAVRDMEHAAEEYEHTQEEEDLSRYFDEL